MVFFITFWIAPYLFLSSRSPDRAPYPLPALTRVYVFSAHGLTLVIIIIITIIIITIIIVIVIVVVVIIAIIIIIIIIIIIVVVVVIVIVIIIIIIIFYFALKKYIFPERPLREVEALVVSSDLNFSTIDQSMSDPTEHRKSRSR